MAFHRFPALREAVNFSYFLGMSHIKQDCSVNLKSQNRQCAEAGTL
jgi:hypothetical protein